jgi:8-oxo-dGTP pyrophosphatase MutT (NUDIX family)
MTRSYDDSALPTEGPTRRPPFDPETAPMVGIAEGAAIPASLLTVERLRRAFVDPVDWTPERSDESRKPRLRRGASGLVPASVLVPIVAREDGPTMLLTERTAHLNDHAGQVSFPGGSAEPDDVDAVDTALRESEEEIGLARKHVEVIGRLPDYPTITGFNVAPIVALVHPPFALTLDAFEVAEAFEVPLAFLFDPANQQRREIPMDGRMRHFLAMPYGAHFIWGATAAMLRNLYLFIAAQNGR